MKPFTTEASNALEGRKLIPRTFSRRQALGLLGGSLAGLTLLSPAKSQAASGLAPPFKSFDHISLECQSTEPGPKFLDGRTADGTVGLAPNTNPPFTGTRWEAVKVLGTQNHFWFFCRSEWPRPAGAPYYEPGNRRLDGRTQNSTVGLAPSRSAPYTGTKWEVINYGAGLIVLGCLGNIPGPRFLFGRPSNSEDRRVGLINLTDGIGLGSHWKVRFLPK